MDPQSLSRRFAVRPLTEADLPALLRLCRSNPLYYAHCPPPVTEETLRADLTALPPGKTLAEKYYLGFFDGPELAAVLDLILDFPQPRTDFIGFFMVDAARQGRGLGSALIGELCRVLAARGTEALRLGWVMGNPQAEAFWKKNGFAETGVRSRPQPYTVVFAQRSLRPEARSNGEKE